MKKIFIAVLAVSFHFESSTQDLIWQKDIKSSTQDFLSQVTINYHYKP